MVPTAMPHFSQVYAAILVLLGGYLISKINPPIMRVLVAVLQVAKSSNIE
jgi:hypothetical protein